jgi:hypothetical protein
LLFCGDLSAWNTPAAEVEVRVEVVQTGTNFSYTVHNDLSGGNLKHVNAWHLQLNAPFQVLAAPAGWTYVTDTLSYIDWISTDELPPYGNDIAPGAALAGFTVASVTDTAETLPYGATSWDHTANKAGPCYFGAVAVPSVTSVVPHFENPAWSQTSKVFQCAVIGVPTLKYAVEASDDLIQWTELTIKPSPFTFVHTADGNSRTRYFRAVYADSFAVADARPDATESSGQ